MDCVCSSTLCSFKRGGIESSGPIKRLNESLLMTESLVMVRANSSTLIFLSQIIVPVTYPQKINIIKMYKVTLLLLLSIFLTAAENCSETASYKLYLTADDPDIKQFIEDGWKKLVEYNLVDGASNYTHSGLFKAQVRVEDDQRKYTILAFYISNNGIVKFSYCYLFAYPIREKPLYIDCYSTGPDVSFKFLFYFFFTC